MKNKKLIIITTTSVLVLGILYLAVKKESIKDINDNPKLKADYDEVIKAIDNAKK